MTLHLGDEAPNFKASTTLGVIDFYTFLGNSWGLLLSHPADYTPVCTTELGRTAQLHEEFKKRNVKAIAVSVDGIDDHYEWIKDINEVKATSVEFPLIADQNRMVSTLYDMIHPNASGTQTVRSVFIISPDKKIRLTLTYPASTGRNFNEILRVIDSLQLTDNYKVSTPADWNPGDDVIISNAVKTEDAISQFPKGINEVKPYLRYTPQPDIE
ncbi:peroxidase [Niastella yeongjuensis]|uniref:Peroxidase n=1 Tax=Niastella yeongjuensis TaxID=354355 RepID=A0A1V9EFD3_9BACT|nr:peroxiredoxin [Niastella yeongjuensis]OQP44826.1 peroxidase [Niastella yeongjuensis]SEP42140.1 Alkyl hydroperoxide reductase subunit AhpC (peroxiredoxin) [Niastella yeongjuensis]